MAASVFERLQKAHGDQVRLASEVATVDAASTGSITLDWATAVGGFPRGRVSEVFGKESAGKTTLSYLAIAEEQRVDGVPVFINLEGNFNPEWAEEMGVDIARLVVLTPATGEQAAEMLIDSVRDPEVTLVIFDSMGSMMSEKELEPDGKDRVGGQAKMITGMMKRVLPPTYENKVAVVILNQARDDMKSMYAGAIESPGGRYLKHCCSIRIELKSGKPYQATKDGANKQIGYRAAALVKKNLLGPPRRVAEFDFIHDEVPGRSVGIDRTQEIIDLSMRLHVIDRAGSYYLHSTFPEDNTGKRQLKSRAAVETFLASDPESVEIIRAELMIKAKEKRGT